MKFSVLIPVYNTEKYLEECLQSILNQKYKNFEIVLVDDGSTDSSGEICDRYQREYPDKIKVIHKANQGQLAARCDALKEADGDYCIFMDADDLIVEDTFEQLNENLCKFNCPDMLIYSFFYETGDGKQKRADKIFDDEAIFNADNKEHLYKTFFLGTGLNNVWTKAVKRNKIIDESLDFSKFFDLRCSEDRLHSMTMVNACERIVYKYIPLYRYRLIDGSVTRRFEVRTIEKFNVIKTYDTEKSFINKWNLDLPEWKFRMDAQWLQQAYYVFDLYYNKVTTKERLQVLQYDWCSFVSKETLSEINNNPYLNDTYKKIWGWIISKNYSALRFNFFKKRLRKAIKNLR